MGDRDQDSFKNFKFLVCFGVWSLVYLLGANSCKISVAAIMPVAQAPSM
jgi:hypothetical protein